jgi:L-ribulose-5-phosphate 4-epimerase
MKHAKKENRSEGCSIYSGGASMNETLRATLEQAHRILHMEGLAEDSSRGHVTARGEGGLVYIKPWGMGFESVKAGELQGVDLDGNLREGQGKMHSERFLHLEIYRKRKDVASVVHVHPYYAILLSSVFKGRISVVSQHGVRFIGKIPFHPSAGLIQTKRLATELALTLGEKPVVLMKNHGITAAGNSIEEAVILAIHFEQAAKDHLLANLFGKPSGISPGEAKKLAANNYVAAQLKMQWDYYVEKLSRMASRPEGLAGAAIGNR